MKRKNKGMAGVLLLCLLFAGCAQSLAKYDRGYAFPFTATAKDVVGTYYAIAGKPDYQDPNPFDFQYTPWFIPLLIVDIPFSLVTDVLTLPYDLYYIRDVGTPITTGDRPWFPHGHETSPNRPIHPARGQSQGREGVVRARKVAEIKGFCRYATVRHPCDTDRHIDH